MRLITQGPKVGRCNLCGTEGPLTQDHIPPKEVTRLGQVAMMKIIDLLSLEHPKKSTRISQDGVKYRTLCKKCNNERLGLGYDPTLILLTESVRACLESSLRLPDRIRIQTKPNRLVRSVVGHLLAQGVNQFRAGTSTERLTDYFLDEKLTFPEELKLYYWPYPYNDQVIIKGAGLSPYFWDSFAVFWLLKFFPICFFIVHDQPAEWRVPFQRLDTTLTNNIDDELPILVDFTKLPPQRWPEAPSPTGMVLHGDGSTGAIPI